MIPDVLFLDLVMPGMSGLAALERIIEQQPDVKIIILSIHDVTGLVRYAIRQGIVPL